MTDISVYSLIVRITADEFLTRMLEVAELVGLPVSSWRPGDPTRTLFRADSEQLGSLEDQQFSLAKAAFIHTAEGDWKTLRAKDTYNVDRDEATFATPSIDLENAGGGQFELDPGGLIVSASGTGALFENQETILITPGPGFTLADVLLIAQTEGAAGTVGLNEIDTIVSPTLAGVTIASSTAASASDAQSDTGLEEECLASLGALSPAGPADAYEYVVGNADLTGVEGITRAKSFGDTSDGTVIVYAATDTAGISGPTVTALQAAVDEWAQPICTDATVASATPQSIAVTLSGVPADGEDVADAAIDSYFRGVDMGGTVARDGITSAVRVALTAAGLVFGPVVGITAPTVDEVLADSRFPVRGVTTYL